MKPKYKVGDMVKVVGDGAYTSLEKFRGQEGAIKEVCYINEETKADVFYKLDIEGDKAGGFWERNLEQIMKKTHINQET